MAVRKVVTRSGRGYRGYFPSKKLRRMVAFESLLERDAMMLFEFSPGVISYKEQPEVVNYECDEQVRRYVPDFEVQLIDQTRLHIEVKPSRKLSTAQNSIKYRRISERYESHSAHFRIITEFEARKTPLYDNLQKLFRAAQSKFDISDLRLEVLVRLRSMNEVSMAELIAQFPSHGIHILIGNGDLHADLDTTDLDKTIIRLPRGDDHATLYF